MLIARASVAAFILQIFLSAKAFALAELQTGILPTAQVFMQADLVFSSHTTLLFGSDTISFGPYYAFESLSQNVMDQTYGAALRIGHETYFEIDGGYFERRFAQRHTRLKGQGYSLNLVLGQHFGDHFGLALIATNKRIQSGDLDARTIYDLLPFFTLRESF